ncbi:MAG: hypothetical protein AAB911_00695, partial [Patescibacteria group bacterium]
KSKKDNFVTYGDMEKLLADQTEVILNAVDERIDKKLFALEARMDQKFDKLITTLDKFLKRMTDLEDEFEMMKHDINRMKRIIKEKLGVSVG